LGRNFAFASEIPFVDITEVTAVRSGLGRRLARALAARSGPPSLRAQLVLVLAAFLLGGVLAGLLFVGVWRHTAAEGDVARAGQQEAARQLRLAQTKLDGVVADLAAARKRAATSAKTLRTTRVELASLHRRQARAAAALAGPLAGVAGDAAALERRAAKLRQALASVADYLHGTSVDPAFAEAQVRYVISSTSAAEQAASAVAAQAARASEAAAKLRGSR
jgi:hypothetical protein